MPYGVFVDQKDVVWLTDFGSNTFVRFDPESNIHCHKNPECRCKCQTDPWGSGEILGAESGIDKIIIKTGT